MTNHRPERTRDEVQLVLDDQLRRRVLQVRTQSEERPGLGCPRDERELINGPDHQCRWASVQMVVNHSDRQAFAATESTCRVVADEAHTSWVGQLTVSLHPSGLAMFHW